MWKWGSGEDSVPKSGVHGTSKAASMSAADLTEQLAQTEQLVVQLKELVKEKENELHNKEQQFKEEKEASEARISKLKLQNKAKVTSLTSQLEELKKQLSGAGTKEGKEQKKGSRDGEQDNAAASRGKILVLKKKIEELETQNAQRNEELQRKIAELDAAYQRGAEMDAMLAEKQKKLEEKEAYIIDLQIACGSSNDAKEVLVHNSELKNQISTKEASLQSMQILVQNLTKKVGDSEEKCSLLEEQIENLKSLHSKEKDHFQQREAMYTQNIRMFQNIIQEKEKELMGLAQKHEQELFKMAAKSDASADLEQLLKALKQKLHEKEEVMVGRTQVIVMLQQELDAKDQQLKEINEHLNRLQLEKDNLQSKLNAEKHVMRAQLRDMMEKHENEMKEVRENHNTEIHELQEKHETELQEKDQIMHQLQKQLDKLNSSGQNNLEQAVDVDAVIKLKLEQLEAQAKLKTEEASKSEARFLKMKAWSKSRIKQLEDDLKKFTSENNNVAALHGRISELEQEKENLQSTLQTFTELKTQNEELLAKLEVYEEQQRKLQADLEQVTKRAASQPSESGSVDELQSRLLEWQEIVTESEDAHNQIREEKSAMALRMAQIEEEREAIVSGQQELEEELATGQGIGRMQPERRKMTQSSRKLQDDYGFDGKHCFEELNVTLDSTDSAEGENMGGWWPEYTSPSTGLRSVVEELELERNQLQEQILFLEERCRDLEDRLQLQGRMEALQNENDRLQSQLTQLRNQHTRDAEKHQALVSSLNEQLKGLNERNGFLESLLGEKDQKISSTTEKLEQIENMRSLLQERDLLNKELGEKLFQTEQKLEDALKKSGAYGLECSEQKAIITELTEKVAAFKEKTVKQDAAIELMRLELEQTNEELDRLNTNHLEERSQLIQDLQRREREIDGLKEVLAEKDKEITALSSSMTEYSEQINILKCQFKCKEDEIREMEEALSRTEREAQFLRDVQTADVKDASTKISGLSDQLSTMEIELAKEKAENEAKTKENEELVKQIKDSSKIIKELNLEIKTHDVTYTNKLMECESQIKSLKEQINKLTEKLHEAERKYKEEIEHLKSQLNEHIYAKEKLNTLLKERENKEQSFVNELKSVKDLYNQLTLENAKKDEELSNLSRQLAKHAEHLEIAKKSLQEKKEIIISLKDKLKTVEQQSEKEKSKLVEELDNKEMKLTEVNNKLHEKCEIISKIEKERHSSILTNSQMQAAIEQKEKDFADQLKTIEDLRSEVHTMEREKQQLISENESLSKLLDMKECELLKRAQSISEMESKMSATTIEHQKIISEVSRDKDILSNKVEELSNLLKQKENSVTEQLLEKQKECGVLTDQLSESRELTEQLHEEIKSFSIQLQDVKVRVLEKEEILRQKESEYNKMALQLSQEKERVSSLQKQIQDVEVELEVKSKCLNEKNRHNDALLKQIEEKQVNVVELERQVERHHADGIQLSHQLEGKDSIVLSQRLELEELQRQIAKKTEECTALSDQIVLLVKEVDVLKCEKDSALAICSAKSTECETFQHQLTQNHSEIVSTKHEAHMLKLENEKLKEDIKTINATLMKKCEGIVPLNSQLSQQIHSVLAITDQIDTLINEIKTSKGNFHAKETLLSQKEAVIQQMKENKDEGEKIYLQMASDLQSQVQALGSEVDQLRQEVQEKENELKKQNQELKLLKNKSEESDLLRVQLSENMEIISDLQRQIENMTKKTEELNKSIVEKDNFLKQKEEECANLQICISQSSSEQQKCVESLVSEAEQLRAVIFEKESMMDNTLMLNNKLKTEIDNKETECEMLRKQVRDLEESSLNFKKEISDQKNLINNFGQVLAEKEVSLLDHARLIEKLSEELKTNEGKLQLVSQLHGQINEITQEIQKSKELAQEKEDAFLSLQDRFAAQYEKTNELNATLSKKEEFISELLNSLDQKDFSVQQAESNVRVLTNEIEQLREELEKNSATLKKLLQDKDENIAISQKKLDSLSVELESFKSEYKKMLQQVELWQDNVQNKERELQVLQEKCTKQAEHIECLNSELSVANSKSQECHDHILLISKLEQQMESLMKDKTLLQENFNKLSVENKQLVKNQNQLQQKAKELQEVHENLQSRENESQMHLHAITLQLENEREQLQMQVSVKGEEVDELKLKVEKLEQGLLESEKRWVTELGKVTQQNEINLTQLSNSEREVKSKDAQIQSLQQEQDMIKKELTRHLNALSHSRYFIKDSDSDVGQQITENKTMLEKLSTLIDNILNKEAEAMAMQQALLQRDEEIHHLNNQLERMQSLREEKEQMQNHLEKVRDTDRSEMEYLSNELSTAKEAFYKQQSLCEERGVALTNMKKTVSGLQEKNENLEKELENNFKTLNTQCQKEEKLLEEVKYKSQMIEDLISQINQQKDLISTLSHKVKEKDSAVTEVMESLSNEMVKFSEEKNVLTIKLQHLEAIQTSMTEEANLLSQQVEQCKKERDLSQILITDKEGIIKDLLDEKAQINVILEKLSQEKDNLKKKLQAALIIRKDLMQKIENLEKIHQESTERECKKTQGLLEQIDELTNQIKSSESLNRNLVFQLEGLKEQLLEKEAKICDISETLSAKTLYLEELQKDVTELKVALAEQKIMFEKNLICLQEKDSLLQQKQSECTERERTYEEERSQLFLTIENLKADIAKKENIFKQTNESEGTLNAGGSCNDSTHLLGEINQLQKEKKILQKKLQALLVARKENTKKTKKLNEEHDSLLTRVDEITKDFEILQTEYKTLQTLHQKKCGEFDSNLLILCSLQETLASCGAQYHSENAEEKPMESKELNAMGRAMIEDSENMMNEMVVKEEDEVVKLDNYMKLMKEKEKFQEELKEKSLEFDRKEEETAKLMISVEQLEQQNKKEKENMLIERRQLQQQLEIYKDELIVVKAVIDEKDSLLKETKEECLFRLEEIEKLKHDIQQANTQMSEKDEEIRYLHKSLEDLKGKFDHGKEIMKEVLQLQENLQDSQEEAKHFKTAFEKMRQEREEFINNLEKSNADLLGMKEELKHASEENKALLIELNMLREKVLPASNSGKNVAVCVKDSKQKSSAWLHSDNVLQSGVQDTENSVPLLDLSPLEKEPLDATHSERTTLKEGREQATAGMTLVQMGRKENRRNCEPQGQKDDAEEKSRERLQRKLQAALISRKEALKENKILKDKIESLIIEKEELVEKTQDLGLLVSQLDREKQELNTALYKEEMLATENTRLLIENENLTAACESLKSTMETIVQEKEAFSFQLNSLKDSQTVELTSWKAKHSELKQEYESLLQAYENISSKIAEMRQIIDVTRKEKQDVLYQVKEREAEKQEIEKLFQKATDENIHLKEQLTQLAESKQKEIKELQTEAEKQVSEHNLCLEEYQKNIDESMFQIKQLTQENKELRDISEMLKETLEKNQKENEVLSNDYTVTKSALRDLQTQFELAKLDAQSKINDSVNERESLLRHIHLVNEGVSEKDKTFLILNQKNKTMSEKLKYAEESLYQKENSLSKLENDCKSLNQEIVSLSERIKILEDDKCLLQEELENVQETSYKVKNEREFLETELLNHIKKLDQTTDKLKAKQIQISLLTQQFDDLKNEKCSAIREKEEQQLHLVRVFEEKVKSAQRDNNGTKNKTKELQELLKEKQQEINQLQKDSIKYQEIILNLEKSVKLSQTKSEKFEKDLNNAEEKLTKSNEEIQNLTEKLSLQKSLLDQSKAEIEQLTNENLNSKKELKKKENQVLNQKKEYVSQLESDLQQLKVTWKKEWLSLEEKCNALEREKERLLGEHHQLQEEISIRDTQNKKLQSELNDALARLGAFAKCMSSLQNDRDRVIGEMKIWEKQFREAIENKQQQIEACNLTIVSLQEKIKAHMSQIQELELKNSVLEESKNTLQTSVDSHHFSELSRLKAENVILQKRQHELATALKLKEDSLQALINEKKSYNHLIKNNLTEKEMEALTNNLTTKEQEEVQKLLLEKNEIQAELEKQVAISDHMKAMLNMKDTEISLLISSKDTEISGYLAEIQTQHRQQVSDYEQQIKSLQVAKGQSDETCQRMKNELKNLQRKADKAVQDKAEFDRAMDAFKKAMSSLQNDRDSLVLKQKNLECEHRIALHEKERLVADCASENRILKQELRKLRNEIDDLHSENAMLTAQLIKYREDLNQVLSLKDNQLKELVTQKLENIKTLEQEKLELQKKLKEMQLTVKVQEENLDSLRLENTKITSKAHDLEVVIASINKERLASESRQKLPHHEEERFDQQNHQLEEKLERRLQELKQMVGKNSKDTDLDPKLLENEVIESPQKRLLEVQFQNKELRSQIESFGKAMTALQDDRERLIEDFRGLQSKYISELDSEKRRADKLEIELTHFKSDFFSVLKENALWNQESAEAESKITLDFLTDELEKLCKMLNTRDLEISRLSSECEKYAQQMDAFSKAMASLQDDRERYLQELRKLRMIHESKQGTSSISLPSDYTSEISSLKHNFETLQVDRDKLVKEGANVAAAEIAKLKAKVDDLERDLHQKKAFQEESEKERTSYQNELVGLRMEKNLLLAESQALQNQFQATLLEKERQIAELQKVHREVASQGSVSAAGNYPTKGLESVTLVGSTDIPDQVNQLLAERNQLQNELQNCLQEMHQRELRFQQINSKVMQSVEENAVLSAQLKTVSQTLRDNQLRYTDLQNRYLRLEREYQVQVASVEGADQGEPETEVPPGAPQERAAVIVEIDNMELSELRKRLAEMEMQHDSAQQTVLQLTETLSEERNRRLAVEEALGQSEEQIKRLEMSTYRSTPRDYTVQMDSDEEREALIINTSEHFIVRKVKGGALSFKRWIRGRSLYCSKLLTSRAKSRYLFLTYLMILHLLVFLCLTGIL